MRSFGRWLGEHVSNWIGHPAEAMVLAMICAIVCGVLVGFCFPVPSVWPCTVVGLIILIGLLGPYWALRRFGYLEPDVPFTFGTVGRPARLNVYRLLTVYIAGRHALGQKHFHSRELGAVVHRIISTKYEDGECAFAVYASSDRPIVAVEEPALLSTLRLFVADGQMYEEEGLFHVTVKGAMIFQSTARAAYETDEQTITLACEQLGLDAKQFSRPA